MTRKFFRETGAPPSKPHKKRATMSDNESDFDEEDDVSNELPSAKLRRRRPSVLSRPSTSKKARSNVPRIEKSTSRMPTDVTTVTTMKESVSKMLMGEDCDRGVSLRVLKGALTLQEDYLREKTKQGLSGKVKPPQIRNKITRLFGISSVTYGEIMKMYTTDKEIYATRKDGMGRSGNTLKKASRIPATKRMIIIARDFVRSYRLERKRVTAGQVLDFLFREKILHIEITEQGQYTKKSFVVAYRNVQRWLMRNNYQRGFRWGSIVPNPKIAIMRDQYLTAFFANRELPANEKLREVYLDESNIHHHHNKFDESVWDPDDDEDRQQGKMQHKGERFCFIAAIQGPDPRADNPTTLQEKAGLGRPRKRTVGRQSQSFQRD